MVEAVAVEAERGEGETAASRPSLTHKLSIPRSEVFAVVAELSDELRETMASQRGFGARFAQAAAQIRICLGPMEERLAQLERLAPNYDFDAATPGNGFRSIVCVVDTALVRLLQLIRSILSTRKSFLFRASNAVKELEAYAAVLSFLSSALEIMEGYMDEWPVDSLFPSEDEAQRFTDLIETVERLDMSCFYGRAIGFHFCSSVAKVFGVVGMALAAYSVSWERGTGPLSVSSMLSSSRFLISPELRAKRIIDVVRHADISFCKGFWNLSEAPALQQLPDWLCPKLAVVRELKIPSSEPLYLQRHAEAESIDGVAYAKIPPPSAHTPNCPVAVRLLSSRLRPGMEKLLGGKAASGEAKSPSLLFHCHGGGFVATTSKSHESYLRYWAKSLDCPVLSVDYALAPENPFPRAVEEVLYAYVWALNHASSLGWTGERICVSGDSAGGNLLAALVVHLIEMGVERIPDGMVMTYAAFVFAYLPSPSRLLTVMDPLLPMGILLRCLAAYTGNSHLVQSSDVQSGSSAASSTAPKKTLQEYMDEMAKAPATQIYGDQRIMSLVNLVSHSESAAANFAEIPPPEEENFVTPAETPSSPTGSGKRVKFEVNEEGVGEQSSDASSNQSSPSSGRRRSKSERPQQRSDSEDSAASRLRRSTSWDSAPANLSRQGSQQAPVPESEETEDPIIEIHADPSRIWLASSVPSSGDGLVSFLARHHLTKNSLILSDAGDSAPTKTPLAPSLSVRSLGYDDEPEAKSQPTPPPPPKPRQSLRRSVTAAVSTTLNVATGHAMDQLSGWLESPESLEGPGTLETKAKESLDPTPTIVKLRQIREPKTNLISPYISPPLILARLPPLHIVAGQLDPLLDDSISFAKKARDAGAKTVTVDLLDGLPHGFLNFTLPSVECRHGAKICLKRITQVLFPPNQAT